MAATPTPNPMAMSPTMLAIVAGRLAAGLVEAALEPLRITLRHYGALGHLAAQPDLSYSDLARRVGVTSQSMRDTIGHLESLGAVRTSGSGQGRASQLSVTAGGRRLLEKARTAVLAADDQITPLLSGTRDETGAALLDVVMALRTVTR
jgi:DNA-binding MarR family transcriptional regulator